MYKKIFWTNHIGFFYPLASADPVTQMYLYLFQAFAILHNYKHYNQSTNELKSNFTIIIAETKHSCC